MRSYLLILSLLFSGVSMSQVAIDSAVDFTVKDLTGTQHHLFDYLDAGNYVVIDFFTANCGPCQTYASEVNASYEYFGCNSGNVVFLGMNWGSDNQSVHIFDSTWGAFYPSVSGLQGGGNRVVDDFQVQSYPTVILIAPDRSIVNNHIWPPETDTINAEVISAGGVVQPCTVGISDPEPVSDLSIKAINEINGKVRILINAPLSSPSELDIFSSDGRYVSGYHISERTTEINITSLQPGIYFARLTIAGGKGLSAKFIIR